MAKNASAAAIMPVLSAAVMNVTIICPVIPIGGSGNKTTAPYAAKYRVRLLLYLMLYLAENKIDPGITSVSAEGMI